MVNRIVLVGRLTRDPDSRRTQNDLAVASFTIAVDDRMKDANGKKTTTFIGVSIFGNAAENVTKFCRKGSLVGVDGRIHQRTYEKQDGTKVSVIEVIADSVQFLEPRGSRQVENEDIPMEPEFESSAPQAETSTNEKADSTEVTDDDWPF